MDTRFDAASITKLLTSVATLQLDGEGRLSLDAPIAEIVNLAGTTISAKVTLRHLRTHTSGLADDADEEAGGSLGGQAGELRAGDARLPGSVLLTSRRFSPPMNDAAIATSATSWSGRRSKR